MVIVFYAFFSYSFVINIAHFPPVLFQPCFCKIRRYFNFCCGDFLTYKERKKEKKPQLTVENLRISFENFCLKRTSLLQDYKNTHSVYLLEFNGFTYFMFKFLDLLNGFYIKSQIEILFFCIFFFKQVPPLSNNLWHTDLKICSL